MFEYETEELKQKYGYPDQGNCALTQQMKDWEPIEEFIQYGNGKPQRLIYSPKTDTYNEEEKFAI